jgi:hypothetical protein
MDCDLLLESCQCRGHNNRFHVISTPTSKKSCIVGMYSFFSSYIYRRQHTDSSSINPHCLIFQSLKPHAIPKRHMLSMQTQGIQNKLSPPIPPRPTQTSTPMRSTTSRFPPIKCRPNTGYRQRNQQHTNNPFHQLLCLLRGATIHIKLAD